MPLVFVHGVNVRLGDLYSREQAFRDRHFVEIFYRQLGRDVSPDSIFNPYWGDLGASISPDTPFLPRGNYQMLWQRQKRAAAAGSASDAAADAAADAAVDAAADHISLSIEAVLDSDSDTPLLDMARTASLGDVIDLLWELADNELLEAGTEAHRSDEEMARLAQRALDFAHSPEGERWLSSVKSDDELLEKLVGLLFDSNGGTARTTTDENTKSARTGIGRLVKSAGGRFRNRIKDARHELRSRTQSVREHIKEDVSAARLRLRQKAVSTTAKLFNEPLRAVFHQQCANLIGDAFSYFSARGDETTASPIAQRVIEALRQAHAISEKTGEELIVIGHSMGGVILCDIVTCYGKDIPIDVLITVGSQFPLFADLQMFPGIRGLKYPVPRPDNVKRWINIFDPHDFLGYPASHIFDGVDDFHLPTYAVGGSAHTNYFNRRSFYFQLARRLEDYVAAQAR